MHSVRVHETDTGWAETELDDTPLFEEMASIAINCTFSPEIMAENKEWKETWECLTNNPMSLTSPQENRTFGPENITR